MKIVLPLSKNDIHLLEPFIELYIALGGTPRQNVIFLPTSGVLPQAKLAADRISPYAKSSTVIPWENDNVQGWPFAGNAMWKHAVMAMANLESKGDLRPWYFMELDSTPLKSGWGDALEAEYAVSGCKFMGAKSLQRQVQGDKIHTFPADDELKPEFMVGSGIYPPGVVKLTDGLWNNVKFEPWDTTLVHYFRRSLHGTKLIQHRWSTINYHAENGVVICENDPNRHIKTDNAGPVDDAAYVLHGCKDGSLMRLILAVHNSAPAKPFTIPTQSTEAIPAQVPENKPEVHYDKSGWNDAKRKEEENGVKLPVLRTPEKIEPEKEPESKKRFNFSKDQKGDSARDMVVECLQNSPKKLRLEQVSKITKIPMNKLKSLCDESDSPFTASKGLGWMKLSGATV